MNAEKASIRIKVIVDSNSVLFPLIFADLTSSFSCIFVFFLFFYKNAYAIKTHITFAHNRSMDILQGNSYAFSAKTASYFVVYSCVASSFACMTKTGYFPVSHVSPYYLRVTCQDVKGNLRLRNIEFSYET